MRTLPGAPLAAAEVEPPPPDGMLSPPTAGVAPASAPDVAARTQQESRVVRVAVVDDDVTIRSLIRMLFARREDIALVGEVADGTEAIEMVRATEPDVVLVDLLMPRLGGHQLLPMLVREAPRTMLLVLSALQAIDEADRSFALGAFAYLEKSVVGPGLADEIQELYGLFSRALTGETVWTPAGPRRVRT